MTEQWQGIGLAIGDAQAVVAGVGADLWQYSEPALVCAASNTAHVELLLAGEEAKSAGLEPLLRTPRRWGYLPGEPAVATELLAALLTTLRQRVPPPLLARPGLAPALALPHTLGATAAAVVVRAAALAGWGEVRLVSELAALAAAQAAPAGSQVVVRAGDRQWVHQATFRQASGELLELTGLQTLPGAGGAPDPAALAAGAARLALAPAGRSLRLGPAVKLQLGLAGAGAVVPLGPLPPAGRLVRALCPPPDDGVHLQLLVGCQDEVAACQPLAEAFLEPQCAAERAQPWLLTVTLGEGLQGELEIRRPGGASPLRHALRIRLP